MGKIISTENFIEKAKNIHGNKYDYSKVEYKNANTKVCIICPEHGEFWQTPNSHLNWRGCPKCGNLKKGQNKKLTAKEFIEKAKEIHGDRYDYSKVNYVNSKTPVCIICPEHGEFYMKPTYHIFNKCDCQKCGEIKRINKRSLTTEEFINRAKKIHGDKYDYSEVEYINNHTKVCIICPEHGEFYMKPENHLILKQGCPKCYGNVKLSTEEFIKKAKEVHRDKYDYSKVEYINYETKVCIICPEHGEFWQTPHAHLSGQGCPHCLQSKLENSVLEILKKYNVSFECQKSFNWLVLERNLRLDFYLSEYNIAIECQGMQHYKPIDGWGGVKVLNKIKKRDKIKKEKCIENGIRIIYIKYNDSIEYIENIIKNIIMDYGTAS